MANIALFHSVLGLRKGVLDAAQRLRKSGHTVYTADLYRGEVFDDMNIALKKFEQIGIPEIMARTLSFAETLPGDTVYAGFSNGGASAELLAASRPLAKGCILFHSALPIKELRIEKWPSIVPVQVHYCDKDPWRNQDWIDRFSGDVRKSGAGFDYYGYPCKGHLFADTDLPDYDHASAELMWDRVHQFLHRIDLKRE